MVSRVFCVLAVFGVACFRVRPVTVVDLGEALLTAAAAQISGESAESLHHEQCEDTQHGKGFCDGGFAKHGL